MPNHLMIDLESIDIRPTGVFFQLAATTFSPTTGRTIESFCMDIDIDDATSHGLSVCPKTLQWWQDQGGIKQVNPLPLEYVLEQFTQWVTEIAKPDYIWSWGIDFDFPMLAHAFETNGSELPWKYWQKRDARTVWALANPGVKHSGQAHDALSDCIQQSKELALALHTLKISPLALI